jgi:hypothetical protein
MSLMLCWSVQALAAASAGSPMPVFARSIVLVPEGGTVYVTASGGERTRLRRARAVPSGSLIDVSLPNAAVELVTAAPRGHATQTADLSGGGVIRVTQPGSGGGITNLIVTGRALACTTGQTAALLPQARVRVPSPRRYYARDYATDARAGSAVGRFRLVGRNESAVNRGAADWQDTEDCHATTMSDDTGAVNATLSNGANSNELDRGETWIGHCSAQPQSPAIGPYCIGVLGDNNFHGFVNYSAGLFVKTPSSTYDLCQTTPAGPQACQTWSFTVPDSSGYREGIVDCSTQQAGSYSMSWQIAGTAVQTSLPYSSQAVAKSVFPCDDLTGTPYSTGDYTLPLPSRIKIVNSYALPTTAWLDFLSVDVFGHGTGTESLVGVVYKDARGRPGRLVATTQRCVIRGTDTKDCGVMSFLPEVNIPAGKYWFGLLTGGKSKVVSVQEGHTALAVWNDNPLSAASGPFGAGHAFKARMSLQIDYSLDPPPGSSTATASQGG